jgi:hypothetical protein
MPFVAMKHYQRASSKFVPTRNKDLNGSTVCQVLAKGVTRGDMMRGEFYPYRQDTNLDIV